MNSGLQKFCVYSGGLMVALFAIGTILAGIFPPPSPQRSAEALSQFISDNLVRVRIGYITGMFAAGFMMPFTAAITWETQKMASGARASGSSNNVAANVQLTCGLMFGASLFFPFLMFMGTAFRPEQDIHVTQGIFDMVFIMFVAPVSVGVFQLLFLGIAMLTDQQSQPTFPRWFGYYTLLVGFDFAGGGFCVLTKTGPFAWDGVISYWIPFVTWGLWAAGMIRYMLKSIDREYVRAPHAAMAVA